MIEPLKLSKYLDKHDDITIEELWLLIRIHINKGDNNQFKITNSNELAEFSSQSKRYSTRNKITREVLEELERKNYIEIWTKEKNIPINSIVFTDKFNSIFFVNDVESCFNEFLDIYPNQIVVNGNLFSSFGKKSREELIDEFTVKILKGRNNIEYVRFIEITKIYLSKTKPVYTISNYFNAFEGIARMFENNENTNFEQNI